MKLRGFAEEQAALQRAATLVARGGPAQEVFAAVTGEVGAMLDCDFTLMNRYDPDRMVTVVGVGPGRAEHRRSGWGSARPSTAGT